MAAWRYEISLLVLKKYFTRSLHSLVKYFSTLEEKFRISVWPCNILYFTIFHPCQTIITSQLNCHKIVFNNEEKGNVPKILSKIPHDPGFV